MPSHTLDDMKNAVLAVALTNYENTHENTHENFTKHKENLQNQLADNNNQIIGDPKPFYKSGVTSPAGYVIETKTEIMVCYHGTQFGKITGSGGTELKHDLQMQKSTMSFDNKNVNIHKGFETEYNNSKDHLLQVLKEFPTKEKNIHLSGHSLGGAVSQIAALDLSTNFSTKGFTVGKVTTFGGPRVLGPDAAKLYQDKGLSNKTLRVVNKYDPVPSLVPPIFYTHAGDKVKLNSKGHGGSSYRSGAERTESMPDPKPSNNTFDKYYKKIITNLTQGAFQAMTMISRLTKPLQSISKYLTPYRNTSYSKQKTNSNHL